MNSEYSDVPHLKGGVRTYATVTLLVFFPFNFPSHFSDLSCTGYSLRIVGKKVVRICLDLSFVYHKNRSVDFLFPPKKRFNCCFIDCFNCVKEK